MPGFSRNMGAGVVLLRRPAAVHHEVCLVRFRAAGLIRRNEVFFDRGELLQALARAVGSKGYHEQVFTYPAG